VRLLSRRWAAAVAGLPLTVALFLAWLVFLRPVTLGGPAGYVIVAGLSMEPAFHTGDLAITQRRAAYRVGDVVAFSTEGGVVIHRIIGGDADQGFTTQGDNRAQPDLWRPRRDDIVGAAWILVPGVGNALAFVRQPAILAGLAAAVAFFLAFTAAPVRRRGRESAPTSTAAAPLAGQGRDPCS
jgi:signal peptidase I